MPTPIQVLRARLKASHIRQSAVATRAQVTAPTLCRFIAGQTDPQPRTLRAIREALDDIEDEAIARREPDAPADPPPAAEIAA